MKLSAGLTAVAALLSASGVSAVAEWGQCGGIGWTGSTTCDSPYVCTKLNDYYYQCLPGTTTAKPASSARPVTSAKPPTSTKSPTSSPKPSSTKPPPPVSSAPSGPQKFKYFGVNESCAEFGQTKIPGVYNTDYTWPANSSIDFFMGKGFNTFRIPFLMERLSPPATGLTGPFDQTYLSGLKTIVSYITSKGGYALVDPHNFLIYNGATISDNNAFSTWWKNLAKEFLNDSHVIFDLQNEPHDVPATQVYQTMQAAVNAIRTTGATQLIVVEGTSWTGAWSWTTGSGNSDAFVGLTDPGNNIAIEMHQYLDSDGSGTSDTCVSSTIGAERLQAATDWLKQHGFKGLLGEIGTGSNDVCIAALKGAFSLMQQPGSPWLGALWWAAGPWWGNYFQSIEPPSGAAISRILPEALQPFM